MHLPAHKAGILSPIEKENHMIELTPARLLERKAENYAIKKHALQMYGEKPYSYHLKAVVGMVKTRMKGDPMLSTYVAVAWLHDVLEDTPTTFEELEREFGLAIAYSVLKLTKVEDVGYEFYMQDIIDHAIARQVKICDTMSNLLESFMTGNKKGMDKYPRQLDILVQGAYYERDH
jgi:(p)ppGpp synthase/HD superfamily hydrolase